MTSCRHVREDGTYPRKGWQDCECGECSVLDIGTSGHAIRLTKQNDTWRVSVWGLGIQQVELSSDPALPKAAAKELAVEYVEGFGVALLEWIEQAREHV